MPARPASLTHSLAGMLLVLTSVTSSQVLPFKTFTQHDGLVAIGVSTLIQDSRGYLWIGTGEGLSAYDGYTFANFRSPGNPSLHLIASLCESRSRGAGVLWIGTNNDGLVLFSNGSFSAFAAESLAGKSVGALLEDPAGNLWCGTHTALYRISPDAGRVEHVRSGPVSQVGLAPDQTVLALIGETVYRFAPTGESLDAISIRGATAFHVRSSGSLWIATRRGEIVLAEGVEVVRRIPIPVIRVLSLTERENHLWIGTAEGVLKVRTTASSFTDTKHYTMAHGLASNLVKEVCLDREGNLWFATGGALQMLGGREVMTIPIEELPLGFFYHPLAVDGSGRFWAVTITGLLELWLDAAGTLMQRSYGRPELGISHALTGVRFDAWGRMWLADRSETLHRFDVRTASVTTLGNRTSFKPSVSGQSTILLSYLPDRTGNIWCNLPPVGVVVFDSTFRPVRTLTVADGLPDADIRTLMQDDRGRIWMGGVKGGIAIVSENLPMNRIGTNDGLLDGKVRSLFQDRQGRVLIGTRTGGLARYERSSLTTVTTGDGLVSDCIWGIGEDRQGRYWLATQSGLQSVNGETFLPDEAARDVVGEGTIACAVSDRAVAAYRYGSVVIAGLQNGSSAGPPPPIHITTFLMNGEPADRHGIGEFPHDRSSCVLEFVGISFRDDQRTRYRYRILQQDTAWSPATMDRRLILPALPPGDYTIQVKALTTDGVESTEAASVSFVVLPPPWRTWWAYAGYVLVLVLAGTAWRRYEIRKIRLREQRLAEQREQALRIELEKQQTRVQIARDLHDEVGSTLSSIGFFAQAMTEDRAGEPDKFLSLISESSTHAKESMRDIIWSIDPASDSWENIQVKLRRYASDLLESRQIRHRIEFDLPSAATPMDPQRRRHFWLLFKEIIANAARHSGGTEVGIRLSLEDSCLTLDVHDDGRGFDPAHVSGGNGLHNIRTRAESLSAVAELATAPGAGTRWVVRIPHPTGKNT